jgi:hypothetical protein
MQRPGSMTFEPTTPHCRDTEPRLVVIAGEVCASGRAWLDSSIEVMARLTPSHDDYSIRDAQGEVIYLMWVQTPSQIARRLGQPSCVAFSVNSLPATDQL